MGALALLEHGATLAGEIEQTTIFQAQFKPCLVTFMKQPTNDASRRNEFILSLTESSEDRALDELLQSAECRSWMEPMI